MVKSEKELDGHKFWWDRTYPTFTEDIILEYLNNFLIAKIPLGGLFLPTINHALDLFYLLGDFEYLFFYHVVIM